MTRYLAGADVGGTFTDVVLYDRQTQTFRLNKVLTTPANPQEAILEGLRGFGVAADAVVHGTTLVTNALIERRGVPVGLITTAGFRDVIEIGTELRYDSFDLQLERPAPLVGRPMRKTVVERIGANGEIVTPLNEDGLREVARELVDAGVRSIAIAFFNAYGNPVHEERAAAIIRALHPDIAVCTSSGIAPEIREFERFSTAVANAYVAPIAEKYLLELERALGVPLSIMLSDGGITGARAASQQPIALVESGPAAGAQGAAFLARQAGWDNVIAFDMGGTTAKVSLIHGGQPHRTHEMEAARLERFKKGSGLPLRIPVIELIEIGAGGGSIAAIDALGLLNVGPKSAGSVPGPACYDRGGSDPTVTDADLVRGYLAPDGFLGGRMHLNKDKALQALAGLGNRIGLDAAATAAGIARIVDNNMAAAAQVHITETGANPQHYRMVAFGGAGPVHAYEIARILGVRQVIFPRGAGVASAIGMLVAPRAIEFTRSLVSHVDRLDWTAAHAIVEDLSGKGRAVIEENGAHADEIGCEVNADMRYVGQGFEITVPVDASVIAARDLAGLKKAFFSAYAKKFGRALEHLPVEVISWRVRSLAPPAVSELDFEPVATVIDEVPRSRPAYFQEAGGYLETRVYKRALLKPGAVVKGPALIEETESTSVIGPSGTVEVDDYGNLIMSIAYPRAEAMPRLVETGESHA